MSERRRELLRWVAYWVAVLAWLGVLVVVVVALHAVKPDPHPEIRHIAAGLAIEPGSPARAVSLPDEWLDRASDLESLRYRFALVLAERPRELFGVYIPTVHLNAAVAVNGEPVGNGGSLESPIARVWPRPLYFVVSPELLRAGRNEIEITVKTEPLGTGLLTDFYTGPDELLQPAYRFRHALKVTVPTVFTGALVVLAALLASITLRRRQDTLYAWLAAILLAFAGFALPTLVKDSPLPNRAWEWLRVVGIGWAVVFMTIFVHRLTGVRRPRVEAIAASVFAASSIAVAFVPGEMFYRWVANLWGALCIGWGLYPGMLLIRSVIRERKTENLLLLLCALAAMVFGAHDATTGWIAPHADGFLLPYVAPLLALIFTWILLSRFVAARREVESLNRDLAQRVADKTAELARDHERLRTLERERALAGERERIMRDMHDGIGGHLVSALALAERGASSLSRVSPILRQANDDLRLVIQSFEPSGSEPSVLLGGLRPTLERQLDAAGIALSWEVTDARALPALGQSASLNLLRIVQEAVTNAIRHSRGTRVTVRSRDADDGSGEIWIDVEDDGQGLDAHPSGRGLANLRARAHAIGAQIEIATASGTRVRVRLPGAAAPPATC